jgi:hypothetical protein
LAQAAKLDFIPVFGSNPDRAWLPHWVFFPWFPSTQIPGYYIQISQDRFFPNISRSLSFDLSTIRHYTAWATDVIKQTAYNQYLCGLGSHPGIEKYGCLVGSANQNILTGD